MRPRRVRSYFEMELQSLECQPYSHLAYPVASSAPLQAPSSGLSTSLDGLPLLQRRDASAGRAPSSLAARRSEPMQVPRGWCFHPCGGQAPKVLDPAGTKTLALARWLAA